MDGTHCCVPVQHSTSLADLLCSEHTRASCLLVVPHSLQQHQVFVYLLCTDCSASMCDSQHVISTTTHNVDALSPCWKLATLSFLTHAPQLGCWVKTLLPPCDSLKSFNLSCTTPACFFTAWCCPVCYFEPCRCHHWARDGALCAVHRHRFLQGCGSTRGLRHVDRHVSRPHHQRAAYKRHEDACQGGNSHAGPSVQDFAAEGFLQAGQGLTTCRRQVRTIQYMLCLLVYE